jgi:hypothetical protein
LYWLSRTLSFVSCGSPSRQPVSNAVTGRQPLSLLSQRRLDKSQSSSGALQICDALQKSVDEEFHLAGPATKTSFVPSAKVKHSTPAST